MTPVSLQPSKSEILAKNRAEYDVAADPYWRLTVYEPTHGGWWFSSIGGRQVLDVLSRRARLGPSSQVLELCCGLGDACRYLASRSGCRATGIDINPQQIELARAGASGHAPDARVDFQVGDVLAWEPGRGERFDAVFGLDALMLLEDRQRVLRTARRALRPGGRLFLAEVFAGPRDDSAVRSFIWEQDGILNLPAAEAQVGALADLGFEPLHDLDLTALAVECFRRMEIESRRHAEILIRDKGRARFERWIEHARLYRHFFEQRALSYALIVAQRR